MITGQSSRPPRTPEHSWLRFLLESIAICKQDLGDPRPSFQSLLLDTRLRERWSRPLTDMDLHRLRLVQPSKCNYHKGPQPNPPFFRHACRPLLASTKRGHAHRRKSPSAQEQHSFFSSFVTNMTGHAAE